MISIPNYRYKNNEYVRLNKGDMKQHKVHKNSSTEK